MSALRVLPPPARDLRAVAPEEFDLIEKVGAGAWGEVWRATQRPTQRTVAIKFLAGVSAPDGTRASQLGWRFQREIEAAAQQDHPHIAAIIASGVRAGQPWFAMEFVEGARLDDFAAALPLPERLALFRRVCEGVQHAHDNGVIHRDLKPANILVRADGIPKILDFGLARFLDDAGLGQTLTLDDQPLGTPLFMAPEQAAGKTREIGVATDIYALGVILYHLATGEWPFDATLPPLQLLAAVRDTEPRPPRGLPRDLAAIIGKAMAREKNGRYPSVRAFSEDLAHFLAGEPVAARAWTAGYVLRKRLRKHWRACAVGVVIFALAAAYLEERRRAAARNVRSLAQARELVNVMLFDLRAKLEAIGQPELFKDITAQAEKLPWPVDAETTGSLDMRRSQALAASFRGDLLLRQGDAPKAMEAYRDAVTHLTALAATHPGETQYRLDAFRARLSYNSALTKAGHHSEAVRGARALLELVQTQRDPARIEPWEKLRAEARQLIGETLLDGGAFSEAEKELRAALTLFSQPPIADPLKQAFLKELLGDIQRRTGRAVEAIATLSEAESLYRRAVPESSVNAAVSLGRSLLLKAAAHLDLQQRPAAQRCLDEARDLCPTPTEKVSISESNHWRRVASGYAALARAYTDVGDDPAALVADREATALWRVVFRRAAALTADRVAVYDLRRHMAEICFRLADEPGAVDSLRNALEQAKRLARDRVDDPRWYLATIEVELRLLDLPMPASTPPRPERLARISELFVQLDAMPAKAIRPHLAKAAELRAHLAREMPGPATPPEP